MSTQVTISPIIAFVMFKGYWWYSLMKINLNVIIHALDKIAFFRILTTLFSIITVFMMKTPWSVWKLLRVEANVLAIVCPLMIASFSQLLMKKKDQIHVILWKPARRQNHLGNILQEQLKDRLNFLQNSFLNALVPLQFACDIN